MWCEGPFNQANPIRKYLVHVISIYPSAIDTLTQGERQFHMPLSFLSYSIPRRNNHHMPSIPLLFPVAKEPAHLIPRYRATRPRFARATHTATVAQRLVRIAHLRIRFVRHPATQKQIFAPSLFPIRQPLSSALEIGSCNHRLSLAHFSRTGKGTQRGT